MSQNYPKINLVQFNMARAKSEIRRRGGVIIRSSSYFPVIYAYRCVDSSIWNTVEIRKKNNGRMDKMEVSSIFGCTIIWL
ncbi:hypothetical protein [Enterobacter huaxiensis]|uniref:hypothetical protein n=1 Tax=Enterobacter huaxiensis TaxID=2494702 RepID=UPI001058513D|nr:hypothetical protein [Enterobacter huaxiensis]UNC52666.1 hypothetical protein D5067_0024140 [Enterobacter huaxiensis]